MSWIGELNNLRNSHPNRKVMFAVDSEVVQDDCHAYWYANDGRVYLDSILDGYCTHDLEIRLDDERCYSKEYDDEELIDMILEEYGHHYENEVDNLMNQLPWKDVIVVRVTV